MKVRLKDVKYSGVTERILLSASMLNDLVGDNNRGIINIISGLNTVIDCLEIEVHELIKIKNENTAGVHHLKVLPEYYKALGSGDKNFEIRKDDRGYRVGDMLVLNEWSEKKYTGNFNKRRITYILKDCEKFGLMDGYVILGLD